MFSLSTGTVRKALLLAAVCFILAVSVVSYHIDRGFEKWHFDDARQRFTSMAQQQKLLWQHTLSAHCSDVLLLRDLPAVASMFNAVADGNMDSISARQKQQLADMALSYLKQHPAAEMLGFLVMTENKQALFHINQKQSEANFNTLPLKQLQANERMQLAQQVTTLNRNETYISNLEMIQPQAASPVYRVAAPVFDGDVVLGVIFISFNAEMLLSSVSQSLQPGQQWFIKNLQGDQVTPVLTSAKNNADNMAGDRVESVSSSNVDAAEDDFILAKTTISLPGGDVLNRERKLVFNWMMAKSVLNSTTPPHRLYAVLPVVITLLFSLVMLLLYRKPISKESNHNLAGKTPEQTGELTVLDKTAWSPRATQFWDKEASLFRLQGDNALFLQMLDMFQQQTPALIHQLDEAIALQACDRIRILAHKLKGSAAAIGANAIVEQARLLEQAATENEMEKACVIVEQLEADMSQQQVAIDQYIDSHNSTNKRSASHANHP